MSHRKPTRNSGLVMKVVSHNYNHLSPRSDLGGQYLVHIVKKVVIWPSPLHNTLTLKRSRGNCGGNVCIRAECEAGCHCINTMLGSRDRGRGHRKKWVWVLRRRGRRQHTGARDSSRHTHARGRGCGGRNSTLEQVGPRQRGHCAGGRNLGRRGLGGRPVCIRQAAVG